MGRPVVHRRKDPRRGAGGARYGCVHALHGSRGAYDGIVEGGQGQLKQRHAGSCYCGKVHYEATSAGGVTALVVKKLRAKTGANFRKE